MSILDIFHISVKVSKKIQNWKVEILINDFNSVEVNNVNLVP